MGTCCHAWHLNKKSFSPSLVTLGDWLVGIYVLPSSPQPASPKGNHTEISVSYKTDWPISFGYLLALVAYINPLFLSMLATGLSTFLSGIAHILLLWCSGQNCGGSFLCPRILLFSSPRFSFLSGWPTYTSRLDNQCLFKTRLTEYRQFSHTTPWMYVCTYVRTCLCVYMYIILLSSLPLSIRLYIRPSIHPSM